MATVVYGYAVIASGRTLRRALAEIPKPAAMARHDALMAAGPGVAHDRATIAAYEDFLANFDDLPALRDMYKYRSLLREQSFASLPQATKENLHAAMASLQPDVARLRDLAAGGGPFVALAFSQGLLLDYGHLDSVNACAMLLGLDLIVKLDYGESADATADAVALLQLAAILAEEPHFMAHVERYGIRFWQLPDTIKRHCRLGAFSDADLTVLLQALAGAGHREGLVAALRAEQHRGVQGFDNLIRSGWRGRARFADRMFRGERDGYWAMTYGYLTPFMRPYHNNEMVSHVRLLDLAAEAAVPPYYEAKDAWDAIEVQYDAAPPGLLRLVYGPRITRIGASQASYESDIHVLQLRLCLERYHLKHGEYPDRLSEVSDLLPKGLPVDPFTGEAFRYMRDEDGGFLLYGVGWNRIDDGGVEENGLDDVWRTGGVN